MSQGQDERSVRPNEETDNSIVEQASQDPIRLAAAVSGRVRIDSVSLDDCELHRERGADIANQALVISTGVHEVEWTVGMGDGITVRLSLGMDAYRMNAPVEEKENVF